MLTLRVDDETIVYDMTRDKASCLNRTASLVMQRCDGKTDYAQIVIALAEELNISSDEAQPVVDLAFRRLGSSHLIANPTEIPRSSNVTRRAVLGRLKAAGIAILLPVVYTIAAPEPASAQSVVCGQVCHHAKGIYCPQGCRCSKENGKGTCLTM